MTNSDFAPFLALTAVFAAALAVLGLRVSMRRFALQGVTLGDGGDEILLRRIRMHGNFCENAPMMLAVVLALGLAQFGAAMGWGAAAAFAMARAAHARSILDDRRIPLRIFAMSLQHTVFFITALALIWRVLA